MAVTKDASTSPSKRGSPTARPPTRSSSFRMLDAAEAANNAILNAGPTFSLGVPLFVLFLGLSMFLETLMTAESTREMIERPEAHIAIFIIGSYVVFSSYFVCDYFMSRHSGSYKIIADDKQFYVLSNLIKSAVLLAYSPCAAKTLWLALVQNVWSTPRIRTMGWSTPGPRAPRPPRGRARRPAPAGPPARARRPASGAPLAERAAAVAACSTRCPTPSRCLW